MTTESFQTTSGKEVTVNISEAGEPESFVIEGVTISENEVMEIHEWIEDYDSEDDDDDDDRLAQEMSDAMGEVVSPYSEENPDNALNTDYSL